MTNPREERPRPTGIFKEESKNPCIIENTLATTGVYSTSINDPNTRMNDHVRASTTDSSLEIMKLLAKANLKLLRPRKIRFCIESRPTKSSQYVRSLAHPSFVPPPLPSNRTVYSTFLQADKSIKVTTTNNTSQLPTIASFSSRKADPTPVRGRCRPVGGTKTPQQDVKLLNVCGNMATISSFEDPRVDEHAPEGYYLTPIRAYKADKTPKGDVQQNINILLKMTIIQKTPCGENKTLKRGQTSTSSRKRGQDFLWR